MTVSVILPNYNHARFLQQRIDSILQQSFQDYELIILDDCSTDDSRQIIELYSKHEKVSNIVFNTVNSGSTFAQWQKGLALARGEYVWIAESDDYCDLNFLEVLVSLLNKKPKAALAYSKSMKVTENGAVLGDVSIANNSISLSKWKKGYYEKGITEIKEALVYQNTIPNASAVLFRKNLVKFPMDKLMEFKLAGDWFFWINMLLKGDVVYTIDTINYFRTHERSVRSSTIEIYGSEHSLILDDLVKKEVISQVRKSQILYFNYQNKPTFLKKVDNLKEVIKKRILRRSI